MDEEARELLWKSMGLAILGGAFVFMWWRGLYELREKEAS